MQPLLQLRDKIDELRAKASDLGINIGLDQDAYGTYFPRTKSDIRRQGEMWAEVNPVGWRRSMQSLVATMKSPGGRDMALKGFKDKTMGSSVSSEIGSSNRLSKTLTSRQWMLGTSVLPARLSVSSPTKVGMRHIEHIADAIGQPVEQVWEEIVRAQGFGPAPRAFAVVQPDGAFHVVENGNPIGIVGTQLAQEDGRLIGSIDKVDMDPAALQKGCWMTCTPQIERKLHEQGATQLRTIADPNTGEALWGSKGSVVTRWLG